MQRFIPPDYVELNPDHFRLEADEIVVACANFLLSGRECPTYMRKGHTYYQFASKEPMQDHHAGLYCCLHRYKRIEGKGEQRQTFTLQAPRIEDYDAYADGCLFNYRAEKNDPVFLARLIPSIERTIKSLHERGQKDHSQHEQTVEDLKDLREFLDHVKGQLNAVKRASQAT